MVKRLCFIAPLCIFLCSCINFMPARHVDMKSYTLSATPVKDVTHYAYKPLVVMINFGQATPGFQGDRMIYLQTGDNQLKYYAYHRWVLPPVTLITSALATALSNTGAYKAVMNAPSYVGNIDYQVSAQLLSLQQSFVGSSQSQEKLALQIAVIDAKTNYIVATKRFEEIAEAMPNAEGGVMAANQALTKMMPAIIQFIYSSIE